MYGLRSEGKYEMCGSLDLNLSERVYKFGSIFLQNGDFDVTVGKFDAKTLERERSDVTVEKKALGEVS